MPEGPETQLLWDTVWSDSESRYVIAEDASSWEYPGVSSDNLETELTTHVAAHPRIREWFLENESPALSPKLVAVSAAKAALKNVTLLMRFGNDRRRQLFETHMAGVSPPRE